MLLSAARSLRSLLRFAHCLSPCSSEGRKWHELHFFLDGVGFTLMGVYFVTTGRGAKEKKEKKKKKKSKGGSEDDDDDDDEEQTTREAKEEEDEEEVPMACADVTKVYVSSQGGALAADAIVFTLGPNGSGSFQGASVQGGGAGGGNGVGGGIRGGGGGGGAADSGAPASAPPLRSAPASSGGGGGLSTPRGGSALHGLKRQATRDRDIAMGIFPAPAAAPAAAERSADGSADGSGATAALPKRASFVDRASKRILPRLSGLDDSSSMFTGPRSAMMFPQDRQESEAAKAKRESTRNELRNERVSQRASFRGVTGDSDLRALVPRMSFRASRAAGST